MFPECESESSLSDLLFGDRSYLNHIFFHSNMIGIYSRPQIHILQHIKLRVSLWTIGDFKKVYLDIDQTTLNSLIGDVIDKIDRFISGKKTFEYFSEGQVSADQFYNYLSKGYVVSGYEKEFKVIQEFHRAAIAFTGDPSLALKTLAVMCGLSRLTEATRGQHFSLKNLKKMVNFLEKLVRVDARVFVVQTGKYDFISRLTLDQRQGFYENARDTIQKYMRESALERPKNWDNENLKAYHIMKILKRNLGFDIRSFTTLDKSIFKKDSRIKFQRHHFRNDFFKKLSNYVQDIILTDSRNHQKYESYSEEEILVILGGFNRMMNIKGTITKADVINIFKGKEWVLNGRGGNGGEGGKSGWFFSDKKFDKRLAEFNDRKDLLKNKGLDQFIIDEYDTVYERFYLNFPHGTLSNTDIADAHGFYSLVVPHPWLGDFAMGMNFDARFLYPEY